MIGGLDRYYQIATCWRDEDLRADRQFEFRQLDLEMAFVEREDVLEVLEEAVVAAFEAVGREPPPRPFPRMSYAEAMAKYGSDKPDLRFGLEIQDATEVTRGSRFGVFAGAETVRFLVAPQAFSRAELSRLEEVAKEWGAKGLAYLVRDESGEVRAPIAKFLSERELEAFTPEPAATTLFAAGDEATVARVLGGLRTHLGRELGLAEGAGDAFHWVVDFPLFERDEDTGAVDIPPPPLHGAGARRRGEGGVRSRRRAQPALRPDLERLGARLGLDPDPPPRAAERRVHDDGPVEEEAREKFGFLLDALAIGAPPHGGFAMGIERFVALLAGEPNIREVIAFPKVSSGSDPLSGAPTPMPDGVLADLGILARTPNP